MIGVNVNIVEDEIVAYIKDITVIPTDVKTDHTTEAQRHAWERYLS